jgi:hypothetical protein
MLAVCDVLLAVVDLGMCAGHFYPVLLEQPTMIVLDVAIAVTHCVTIVCHISTRREHHHSLHALKD